MKKKFHFIQDQASMTLEEKFHFIQDQALTALEEILCSRNTPQRPLTKFITSIQDQASMALEEMFHSRNTPQLRKSSFQFKKYASTTLEEAN